MRDSVRRLPRKCCCAYWPISKVNLPQVFQQAVQPQLRTFATWWFITTIAASGVTEPHRNNRELRLIVKCGRGDSEPAPKTAAARVVPRNARCMHARTRRLSDNQDARVGSRPHDRPRTEWQVRHTCPTGAHLNQNRIERRTRVFIHFPATSFPGRRHGVCVAHQRTPATLRN